VGRRTAYTGHSCRSSTSHENCQFHGRNDTSYLDWRWEPFSAGVHTEKVCVCVSEMLSTEQVCAVSRVHN